MVDDVQARWDRRVAQPFAPEHPTGGIDADKRAAIALEYIAAHMFRISAALEKIGQRLEDDPVLRKQAEVSADTSLLQAKSGRPPA